MSRPRYYWYGIVRKMIMLYPELKDEQTPQGLSYRKAIDEAIAETKALENGEDRMRAVEIVMFQKKKDMYGASMELNYSWRTIQNWINDFIDLAGKYVGF